MLAANPEFEKKTENVQPRPQPQYRPPEPQPKIFVYEDEYTPAPVGERFFEFVKTKYNWEDTISKEPLTEAEVAAYKRGFCYFEEKEDLSEKEMESYVNYLKKLSVLFDK